MGRRLTGWEFSMEDFVKFWDEGLCMYVCTVCTVGRGDDACYSYTVKSENNSVSSFVHMVFSAPLSLCYSGLLFD